MHILIVDDHSLFADGLSHIVRKLSDDTRITAVCSVDDAINKLSEATDYDLVMLDINMPAMDGLTLLQRLHADDSCIPIVIISSETRAGIIQRALALGAMGFIPKSHRAEEMLEAINSILEGSMYVPKDIQRQLDRLPTDSQAQDINGRLQQCGISKRQHQTLMLVAQGLSNQQIATTLNRSEHTIKSHVSALLQILGASNRTECVILARQQQLIEDKESLDSMA